MSHAHRIAVIGGDGIGPEVTNAAFEVVRAAGVTIETTDFDLGAARYLRDGFVLDDATLAELKGFDAVMLGAIGPAIGDTRIPGGTLERGLLLKMRFGLDLYINYRPFRGVPGSSYCSCVSLLPTPTRRRPLSRMCSQSSNAPGYATCPF